MFNVRTFRLPSIILRFFTEKEAEAFVFFYLSSSAHMNIIYLDGYFCKDKRRFSLQRFGRYSYGKIHPPGTQTLALGNPHVVTLFSFTSVCLSSDCRWCDFIGVISVRLCGRLPATLTAAELIYCLSSQDCVIGLVPFLGSFGCSCSACVLEPVLLSGCLSH